jgi:thioester reductase-like protein
MTSTARTDIAGMQRMLDTYTKQLLQSAQTCSDPLRPKTFAIIGSTGYLGPHIVAALLRTHSKSNIFCLNRTVTGKQRTEVEVEKILGDIPIPHGRLHFLIVDLTQPAFGMESTQASMLARETDELIFNAWNPHWGKDLAYFEPLLKGVRNAVDFCATASNGPRLTFVSSVCAVGDWPMVQHGNPVIPEDVILDLRSAMPHGYGESKHVAERILAAGSAAAGVPVSIVRAGQIGGPSTPKLGIWPRQSWLCAIMETSQRTGTFPKHVQRLDWIPVDQLADAIANTTMRPRVSWQVEVFNLVHPEAAPWRLFLETLQCLLGLEAREVDFQDWLDCFGPSRMPLYSFFSASKGGRELNMAFEGTRAQEVLPELPAITQDLLETWIRDWDVAGKAVKAKL